MSESTSTAAPHQPGVYVKGDVTRVATTPAKAVSLVFEGYVRQGDAPDVSNTLETEPEPTPEPAKPTPPAKPVPTPPVKS